MARARLMSSSSSLSMPQLVGLAAMSVALCAFAVFKCTSYYSRKWRNVATSCYGCGFPDPVIQYKGEPRYLVAEDDEGRGDATLWQRNILMGGKCQMPDFSGVIIYDVTGNVVPPRKASRTLTS
uniref:Uncharacterized protein n=1 Tax=Kalanchoe fedtschenkoi TaxID=63787 RepID=A0A7N1A137_KALFE